MSKHILQTGQVRCYDSDGSSMRCPESGQDGEFSAGHEWPQPRFQEKRHGLIEDLATGLYWPADLSLLPFPMSWEEGFAAVEELNGRAHCNRTDWRMPNRRELRSLISHGARKPALPNGHPFTGLFLGWYWTSTTASIATSYAWYVHLEGGRMFYGRKDSSYLIWPVCGKSEILPQSGQSICYDRQGRETNCGELRQDGSLQCGAAWPHPRFVSSDYGIRDSLTNLIWHQKACFEPLPASWGGALTAVRKLARDTGLPWRLPNINELESLVDASCHTPALPADHPFSHAQQAYWSSTTSFFETDWAYVLYLDKGAVGVGYKKKSEFAVWPVMDFYSTS